MIVERHSAGRDRIIAGVLEQAPDSLLMALELLTFVMDSLVVISTTPPERLFSTEPSKNSQSLVPLVPASVIVPLLLSTRLEFMILPPLPEMLIWELDATFSDPGPAIVPPDQANVPSSAAIRWPRFPPWPMAARPHGPANVAPVAQIEVVPPLIVVTPGPLFVYVPVMPMLPLSVSAQPPATLNVPPVSPVVVPPLRPASRPSP